MKVLPRRLRTHYYRDRAEHTKRMADIARTFEQYRRTIWTVDLGAGPVEVVSPKRTSF